MRSVSTRRLAGSRSRSASSIRSPAFIIVLSVALLVLARARPVFAQQPVQRIGPFVLDVRGAMPKYGQNADLAVAHGLNAGDLPSRGFGVVVDGHYYFLKWHAITFGIGGQVLLSRGHNGGSAAGPAVTTTFKAFSPQISFNFGTGRGWSYLSGGVGRSTLVIQAETAPAEQAQPLTTINYGGGARWFMTPHLAFTFDVRFYDIGQHPASAGRPGNPHLSMFVLSAGVALK